MRALTCECGAADSPSFSATISSEGGSSFALEGKDICADLSQRHQ